MESTSILINPFLIKEILNSYTDSSSFANYQKISHDYYKLYSKILKKFNNYPKEKLRNEVKHWLFAQSLENRIKICTVENEFLCQIIYQMHLYTQNDKNIKFYLKQELTDVAEINQRIILKNFNENKNYDFGTYITLEKNDFSLYPDSYYKETNNKSNINYLNTELLLNEIYFYSVHHKPFPDCFCLSPNFLLQEDKFYKVFNDYGNSNCCCSLIQPYYNNEKKIYSYKLPNWLSDSNKLSYSITEYMLAFIEQAIMIKYILNNYTLYNNNRKNNNKMTSSIFSLINDEILNRIFIERKTVINYLDIKYREKKLKKELINEAKIENIHHKILLDNQIMNKIVYFRNFERNKNYNEYGNSMLTQPLLGINNCNSNSYIFNTLYDDFHFFFYNNPQEQNNYILKKITKKLEEVIEGSDNNNIIFFDYLLFHHSKGLWEFDHFINIEIIEFIINRFNEQNYNDLLKEEAQPLKKKNRRKKKKKNQNNENTENNNNTNSINIIDNKKENNKEENENNIYKIELECYNELFKDKEKLLYIPYYLDNDVELKIKYKKLKENKLKLIEEKNKKQDIKEISNYIKNEFLLKYIIDKVIYLQTDNYVSFFENDK